LFRDFHRWYLRLDHHLHNAGNLDIRACHLYWDFARNFDLRSWHIDFDDSSYLDWFLLAAGTKN
jgi:hypothetical protein